MLLVEELPAIGPEMNGTLMSPEEFDCAEEWEEGYLYELVNGVLVVSPPPDEGQRGPNDFLGYRLRRFQEESPLGRAMNSTLPEHTVVTRRNRRCADRVIWCGLGRAPNTKIDTPAIIVEFVSQGRRSRRRDYETKRREYGEIGVREYWIVDRFDRKMTVVRYDAGNEEEVVCDERQTYTTPLLPGFELSIGRLMAESDMLDAARED